MNKVFAALIMLLAIELSAQDYYEPNAVSTPFAQPTSCVTVGILQGGGSLLGADVEVLLTDHIGAQVGAGLVGFGAGFNIHFKPGIRSSFISIQYWNQGIGNSFTQSLVGPNFVYRSKKWFTFQVGLGAILDVGELSPYLEDQQPDLILTYAIGAYFPW